MKLKFRRPSPAMVVACLALFVASTGTSIAASHYLITSTKQIKPSVLKALKGAKGPAGQSVTGLTGPQGPAGPKGDTGAIGATGAAGATGAKGDTGAAGAKGDPGPAGAAGAQGPSGVVKTVVFHGSLSADIPYGSNWVFAGGTTTVTTTAGQRLTGAAEMPLGSAASTSGEKFNYDLCYQQSTGGTLVNFANGTYSTGQLWPDRRTFAAAASVVPPSAGTWNVGFCVQMGYIGNNPITTANSDWSNGWVQVTN